MLIIIFTVPMNAFEKIYQKSEQKNMKKLQSIVQFVTSHLQRQQRKKLQKLVQFLVPVNWDIKICPTTKNNNKKSDLKLFAVTLQNLRKRKLDYRLLMF